MSLTKDILIDCTPPVVKYPLLCAGALACGGAACLTGDPIFLEIGRAHV